MHISLHRQHCLQACCHHIHGHAFCFHGVCECVFIGLVQCMQVDYSLQSQARVIWHGYPACHRQLAGLMAYHFKASAPSCPCGYTCRPIIQIHISMLQVPMYHSLFTLPVACRQLAAAGSSSRRTAGPDLLSRQARHLSRHRLTGGCAPPGHHGHHGAPALAQCGCWRLMQPGPCQSTQSGVLAAHLLCNLSPLVCNLHGRTRHDTLI